MAFDLPRDAASYASTVFTRCYDLLETGIWSGVDRTRLRGWISNFTDDREQYFCACILDALIYRSDSQVYAMLEQLIQRTWPDLLSEFPAPFPEADLTPYFCSPATVPFRLVAVKGEFDPLTKSSGTILRHLSKRFGVNPSITIEASQIEACVKSGINAFIFVDDLLGTGDQFTDLCNEIDLKKYLNTCYIAFTPLVAHVDGIQSLYDYDERIRVKSVEVLDERYSLFSASSSVFDDGVNTSDGAREFYYDLVAQRGLTLPSRRRGHGNLELLYAFEDSAPDNCLPILWHEENGKWQRLFRR